MGCDDPEGIMARERNLEHHARDPHVGVSSAKLIELARDLAATKEALAAEVKFRQARGFTTLPKHYDDRDLARRLSTDALLGEVVARRESLLSTAVPVPKPTIRVVRVLEYTYDDPETMKSDMERWVTLPGPGGLSPGVRMRTIALPPAIGPVVDGSDPGSPEQRFDHGYTAEEMEDRRLHEGAGLPPSLEAAGALACGCCSRPYFPRARLSPYEIEANRQFDVQGRDRPFKDDPWEGRLDGYCFDCASARCDAYPGECPNADDEGFHHE